MGGVGSSSLPGSNDGSLKLPILRYILIVLHVYIIAVVDVSIGTGDGLVERVYLVKSTIRINCSLNDSNQRAITTDIVWTFDGEVLNVTTSQLVIENAQFEDSGVYECKVDGHSQDVRWDVKVGSVERVYLVNSTIRINCILNDSNQRANTTDIVWTFDGEVLNVTTSQLVIENAQFEDSGVYVCKVDGHSQEQGIRWDVKVGLPPTKAKDISCNSYDFFSMNCSWTNGRFTNLDTRHVLQCSKNRKDFINYQKNESCENESNDGIQRNFCVRVNSSNALAVGGIQSKCIDLRTEDIMIVTPIRSPIVTNVTFTSLQVSWQPSEEYQCYPSYEKTKVYYLVKYTLENTQDWHAEELHRSKHQLTIGGLQANSVYTIAITVKFGRLKSEEMRLLGRTKETAPEAGVSLDLLCSRINGTNETLLSWTRFPEDKSNGKILSYDITKNHSSVITKDPNATQHRLQGVDMYSDFIVTIVARNSAGSSDVNECYIPALPRADHLAVVSTVLIIVGAVLFVVIFILAFKFYICFKKSKITEIKLPHHIQHDNFYLFGGPQRRAPCEQERYDELITQSLVEKGTESCNSTIPSGKKDPSREPIMPEPITTKVSTT